MREADRARETGGKVGWKEAGRRRRERMGGSAEKNPSDSILGDAASGGVRLGGGKKV